MGAHTPFDHRRPARTGGSLARRRLAREDPVVSDDRNRPRSTTSAQPRTAERASARRQEAQHELTKSRRSERRLARRQAAEQRKARSRSAARRKVQHEAAEHRAAERDLAARRKAQHELTERRRAERDLAARRAASQELAERDAAQRREAQQAAAERRAAERDKAQQQAQQARQQQAVLEQALQERAQHEKAPREPSETKRRGPGLLLLLAGLAAGALAVAVLGARQRKQELAPVSELELELRDEQAWTYETKMVIYAPAGAIAGHVHDVGGLPGLVGPLDGPPMDRVDWTEPHGARLRFQVHARSGGGPSDTTVQIARGARTGPLTDLEGEVRDALAALRTRLERA